MNALGRLGARAQAFLVAGFFLLVAIVATWPLLLRAGTHLPAGANDLYQNVWNFWWWRKALFELDTSPLFTPYLFAPDGLDLTFHTHSPFNMLITMPVNMAFGPVAAYNAAAILAVFLCGLGAYLFAREVVRDDVAAIAAGILFAIFPQHQEQLFEHLNLFSCQFMPFALLFLVRTFRHGTTRDGVLAGFFFALNALACFHLALLLTMLAIPFALYHGWRSPCRRRAIGRLAIGALLAAAAVLPFVAPMLSSIAEGTAYYKKPLAYRPIDPAFLVLPPPQGAILGGVARDAYLACRGPAFQYAGFICFLGWVPLGLLAVALASLRRKGERGQILLWCATFLGFLLFALGSHPTIAGTEHPGISLPQGWTQGIMPFRVLRVANRYLIPASIAFAALVAWGVSRLPRRPLLRGAAAAAILFEYLWTPFPLAPYPRYPFMDEIARDPDAGIVLDIPVGSDPLTIDNLVRQIAHEHPIVGGYAACVPPRQRDALFAAPEFQGLAIEEGPAGAPGAPPYLARSTIERLRELGIRTIIVKPGETREALRLRREERIAAGELPFFLRRWKPARGIPEERLSLIIDQLERTVGKPIHEDGDIMIWRIR